MTERKNTVPMSAAKRKTQVTNTALKLAKKGGRLTLAAVAAQLDITAPLVANYLGRGPKFEKSVRDAAAAAGATLPESFCVQGGKKKAPKKAAAKKVTAKQVKAIKLRIPKPKVPTVVVPVV